MVKLQDIEVFENLENPLQDFSATGRKRPWKEKKTANELLAVAYDSVDVKKAARLRECSKFLRFRLYEDGSKELDSMSSCRVRLCPVCAWRRSLLVFATVKQIVDFCTKSKPFGFIFLTLTVRNCTGDRLSDTLDSLMQGWNKFIKLQAVDRAVKGWYRGMEVTHNVDMKSESYDTYHPHFHCLLMVNKNYFSDPDSYLSQEQWRDMWRRSMCLDYEPQVNVKRVRGGDMGAIAECAKYAVKDSDYLIPDDWNLTVETVRILDKALHNRRFVAYGKRFKEAKKLLKLDDEENGSLIDVGDGVKHGENEPYVYESYFWFSGYRQYFKIPE